MLFPRIILAFLLAAVPPTWTSGQDADCDGVLDGRDLWVRATCREETTARPMTHRVAFAVVGNHAPRTSDVEQVTNARSAFLDAFAEATGGRVRLVTVGEVVPLALPGLASLDARPASLTSAYFLAEGADPQAEVLILVSVDVPTASRTCGCVAWSARATDPSAFGAPNAFMSTIGLSRVDELGTAEARDRFLHEIAHAWCCRISPDHPVRPVLDADGAHWREGSVPSDPMDGDGTHGRAAVPLYSDATLVLMGAMDPQDAEPIVAPDGRSASGWDILFAMRASSSKA